MPAASKRSSFHQLIESKGLRVSTEGLTEEKAWTSLQNPTGVNASHPFFGRQHSRYKPVTTLCGTPPATTALITPTRKKPSHSCAATAATKTNPVAGASPPKSRRMVQLPRKIVQCQRPFPGRCESPSPMRCGNVWKSTALASQAALCILPRGSGPRSRTQRGAQEN